MYSTGTESFDLAVQGIIHSRFKDSKIQKFKNQAQGSNIDLLQTW